MTPYEAIALFSGQIARHTRITTITSPSPLKDPAPHVKVAVRKILRSSRTQASKGSYEIRLFVSVDGMVESDTGLRLAVEACQALVDYLANVTRLEHLDGAAIADTRVTATVNEEDGILEDPDNGNVAWIDDVHFVTLSIPV